MKCYLVADVHTTNQGRPGACSSIKISFLDVRNAILGHSERHFALL